MGTPGRENLNQPNKLLTNDVVIVLAAIGVILFLVLSTLSKPDQITNQSTATTLDCSQLNLVNKPPR